MIKLELTDQETAMLQCLVTVGIGVMHVIPQKEGTELVKVASLAHDALGNEVCNSMKAKVIEAADKIDKSVLVKHTEERLREILPDL